MKYVFVFLAFKFMLPSLYRGQIRIAVSGEFCEFKLDFLELENYCFQKTIHDDSKDGESNDGTRIRHHQVPTVEIPGVQKLSDEEPLRSPELFRRCLWPQSQSKGRPFIFPIEFPKLIVRANMCYCCCYCTVIVTVGGGARLLVLLLVVLLVSLTHLGGLTGSPTQKM